MYRFFWFCLCLLSLQFCSESSNGQEEVVPNCDNTTLQLQIIEAVATACGETNGKIVLEGAGGSGKLQYTINGFQYFDTNSFETLSSGVYFVKVRDELGCEVEDQVLLDSEISLAADVFPILSASCALSGCHRPAEQSPNFTIASGVIAAASNIKRHMEDNTMPPLNSGMERIPEADRQTLICWVNDGARDN